MSKKETIYFRGAKTLNKRLKEAVGLLLKEDYHLTDEAYTLLSKTKDPIEASKNILMRIKGLDEKPKFVTQEFVKESLLSHPTRQVYKTFTGEEYEDWTFATADTQYMTHGLHPYPARMIPQIAERLIERYSSEGDELVLDPFCGSGTVLAEAALKGKDAIGVDIDPLAVIISKAKAVPISPDKLNQLYSYFLNKLTTSSFGNELKRFIPLEKIDVNQLKECIPLKSTNVEYWFGQNTIKSLSYLRMLIREFEDDEEIKYFLYTCFSNTLFKHSWAKFDGSSTHLRKNVHDYSPPEIFKYFLSVLESNKERMKEYYDRVKHYQVKVEVKEGDSRKLSSLIGRNVGLIVTSPPYGEERNTINYTRWSKLALFWLGYDPKKLREKERETLGGKPHQATEVEESEIYRASTELSASLNQIKKRSSKRLADIYAFFNDYLICLKEMRKVLDGGKNACIVISSVRRCCGFPLNLGKITQELAEHVGFRFAGTYHREFPYKTIPWMGISGETMSKEDIVILQKAR